MSRQALNDRLDAIANEARANAEREELERRADELVERQRTVHERVACPRCSAPVSVRCKRMGNARQSRLPLKHPHVERLRADGMELR